jgi:hypothetical protein
MNVFWMDIYIYLYIGFWMDCCWMDECILDGYIYISIFVHWFLDGCISDGFSMIDRSSVQPFFRWLCVANNSVLKYFKVLKSVTFSRF